MHQGYVEVEVVRIGVWRLHIIVGIQYIIVSWTMYIDLPFTIVLIN